LNTIFRKRGIKPRHLILEGVSILNKCLHHISRTVLPLPRAPFPNRFRRLHTEVAKSLSCLFVRPHATAGLSLDWFSWNFIFYGTFLIPINIADTLHEGLRWTVLKTSRRVWHL